MKILVPFQDMDHYYYHQYIYPSCYISFGSTINYQPFRTWILTFLTIILRLSLLQPLFLALLLAACATVVHRRMPKFFSTPELRRKRSGVWGWRNGRFERKMADSTDFTLGFWKKQLESTGRREHFMIFLS